MLNKINEVHEINDIAVNWIWNCKDGDWLIDLGVLRNAEKTGQSWIYKTSLVSLKTEETARQYSRHWTFMFHTKKS